MIWYLEDFQRLRREREALEALATSVDWLTPITWRIDDSVRLIWDADISTPAGLRAISLRYPGHFPHSPPSVLPRDDSERWSDHQYGPGGELCLEFGPDNWHPDITGADLIASAQRLLQGERPTPSSRRCTFPAQDHSRTGSARKIQPFPRDARIGRRSWGYSGIHSVIRECSRNVSWRLRRACHCIDNDGGRRHVDRTASRTTKTRI